MSMIDVRGLSKSFDGQTILENVSLSVEKGETVAIIGPSGCGKSTFLRCLNLMETPTSGSVFVLGQDLTDKAIDVNLLRAKIGMVYQQFYLFSHLNVMENMILAPMKVRGISKKEAIDEAEQYLERVGLGNRMYHMPSQLSGGQKQRVAIMRCLMMKPKIILFDEPTSALDPTMVDEVEHVISTLVKEGMTSIIVTHEMDFARSVASKVVYFDEKGIYEMGTPEEIFDAPKRHLTRLFVEKLNAFERFITKDNDDILALMSEIRRFCIPYGFTARQMRAAEAILDEVVLPIVRADSSQKAILHLYCSTKSNTKEIAVQFDGLVSDPLGHESVDPLGIVILTGLAQAPTSTYGEHGWKIRLEI